MVIYAERTRHWWELAVLVGYGVVVGGGHLHGLLGIGAHRAPGWAAPAST
jgi:hypothetical protein